KKPITTMTSDRSAACKGVNGVIHDSPTPIKVALRAPPAKPSTVFDGDSFGAILVRPNSFPQTYCSTSLDCTTITRKAISSTFLPSYPGISRLSSAGTCETQN